MTIQQCIWWFILICFLLQGIQSSGQSSNIGAPPITNFLKKDYKGSPQNWDIAQSTDGLLYIANHAGLLEFDGKEWRTYKVSNQTIVRSVEIAEDGKIFVGAQGEIGYFAPNDNGVLSYHSMTSMLPPNRQTFADIWDIEILDGKVFFRAGNMMLLYHEDQLEVIYEASSISHSAIVQNQLYINEIGRGLLIFDHNNFTQIPRTDEIRDYELNGLIPFGKDSLLISTLSNGIFLYSNESLDKWQLNDNDFIESNGIQCIYKMDENQFALGTPTEGIFILNNIGQVIHHIDCKAGLQVNKVLSLFLDKSKNLWVGLDNGIDYIETNSPFTLISPNNDNNSGPSSSTGYAIEIFEDRIYFGGSNGVYSKSWKTYYNPILFPTYKMVKNSGGQVWDLSIHGDDLFMNHHEGIFTIKNNTAQKISAKNGAWMQLVLEEDKLLSGHYDGLSILEKDQEWKETKDFKENWLESCRIIVKDEKQTIWISHPYRGVYKVDINEASSTFKSAKRYDSKDGFPSNLMIYAFKVGDEVIFCAEKGVYFYNYEKDRFEINEKWTNIFGEDTRIKSLIEAPNDDIWFVTNKEIGVLKIKDAGIYKDVEKQVFPQLQGKLVDGFEEIYPYDDENVFIAYESGFIHFNPKRVVQDKAFNTSIRLVQNVQNDSIIFGGSIVTDTKPPEIDYKNNAIQFHFAATCFENLENNLFQYKLKGFDEKWSNWSTKSQVDYTNLHSGKYTFLVKAKNIHETSSNIASFDFKIAPPWYATTWAFAIYFLLITALLFSMIFIPKQKFNREKAALETAQQKTLQQIGQEYQLVDQQNRQQISKLEQEKMRLQILSKNQELASNTMHLAQKSEMLKKIKEDIQKIAKNASDPTLSKQLNRVIQKVSADERLDNDWQQFAKHFDQVHSKFLLRLQAAYPRLSPKDHRLCAFLRMNLTSKEMAPLMNISVRSVEVARYRLRKKMELDGTVNLVEFMMGF